jgi:hypothetical protein
MKVGIVFFAWSELLDREVLRPLRHSKPNWELTWDHDANQYVEEEDSYAHILNDLFCELEGITPPKNYHKHEDYLAKHVRSSLHWKIEKRGRYWIGEEYGFILEQGGFCDFDQERLVLATSGRVRAAIEHGQFHYDDMETCHRKTLAALIVAIMYHRTDFNGRPSQAVN